MAATRFLIIVGVLSTSAACVARSVAANVMPEVIADSVVPLVMEVAPARVGCTGLVPMRCLQVRFLPDTTWRRFFDPIEGFRFEEGYWWRLVVERLTVTNPRADGSSYAYRLIQVVSRRRE